jgi:hypothetical protein
MFGLKAYLYYGVKKYKSMSLYSFMLDIFIF